MNSPTAAEIREISINAMIKAKEQQNGTVITRNQAIALLNKDKNKKNRKSTRKANRKVSRKNRKASRKNRKD